MNKVENMVAKGEITQCYEQCLNVSIERYILPGFLNAAPFHLILWRLPSLLVLWNSMCKIAKLWKQWHTKSQICDEKWYVMYKWSIMKSHEQGIF